MILQDKEAVKSRGRAYLGAGTRAEGFSLLELLTVLLLLGVVAAVSAPAIGRMLDGMSFRQQVGDVLANLRQIRLESVSQGRDIRLRLEGLSFVLVRTGVEEEEEIRALPVDPDSEMVLEPATVLFTSESMATPATLRFSQGLRARTIALDPLTALPVVQ